MYSENNVCSLREILSSPLGRSKGGCPSVSICLKICSFHYHNRSHRWWPPHEISGHLKVEYLTYRPRDCPFVAHLASFVSVIAARPSGRPLLLTPRSPFQLAPPGRRAGWSSPVLMRCPCWWRLFHPSSSPLLFVEPSPWFCAETRK